MSDTKKIVKIRIQARGAIKVDIIGCTGDACTPLAASVVEKLKLNNATVSPKAELTETDGVDATLSAETH